MIFYDFLKLKYNILNLITKVDKKIDNLEEDDSKLIPQTKTANQANSQTEEKSSINLDILNKTITVNGKLYTFSREIISSGSERMRTSTKSRKMRFNCSK